MKADRHQAALKSWRTRRKMSAFLRLYCNEQGWKLALFAGATGSPRTDIVDAIAFRLGRKNADIVDIRLIQLKGGSAGVSGSEIARLKKAAASARVSWVDGESLHLLPDQ